ncbi:MAG: hypothetical protein A2289_08630 [Deltaproteobacteria bacterium RIFOXYA12_FULL_58_15]|nr:MAG: hypothetical protein A2289_08630 [Deltaproteobacteria bacterium RIFOXYA12_FULL_58_15]
MIDVNNHEFLGYLEQMPKSLSQLVGNHPLFAAIDPTDIDWALRAVRELHHAPADILYTSGKQADMVFVVLHGGMQIEYPVEGETRGQVATLLVAPALLGECQVLSGQPWSGTGVALTELQALGFGRDSWLELLQRNHEIARRLYLELAGRFLLAIETWRHQPELGPDGLIARYLCAVAAVLERAGVANPNVVELGQLAIACATGLSRETVNRILRNWHRRGLVTVLKNKVEVKRVAKLELIAGEDWQDLIKSYWTISK